MDWDMSSLFPVEQLAHSPQLLDHMRAHLRTGHYSLRIEQAHVLIGRADTSCTTASVIHVKRAHARLSNF